MTWKQRQSLGKCQWGKCGNDSCDGANYCAKHLTPKRSTNAKYMAWTRLYRRVQLGLGL